MRSARTFLVTALTAGLFVALSPGAAAQRPDADLAQALRSSDCDQQTAAMRELAAFTLPQSLSPPPVESIPEIVRAALLEGLERENLAARERRRLAPQRVDLGCDRGDEGIRVQMLRVVRRMDDPAAIPALVGALDTGLGAVRAVASFGSQAAGQVLAMVNDPSNDDPFMVSGGLTALRFMVEAREPLPDAVRTEMAGATERFLLSTEPSGGTMVQAMGLALVLGDARLREVVTVLATDPAQVLARGVARGQRAEAIQDYAREWLEGEPPLPRP